MRRGSLSACSEWLFVVEESFDLAGRVLPSLVVTQSRSAGNDQDDEREHTEDCAQADEPDPAPG
jgi:hypothetical protein